MHPSTNQSPLRQPSIWALASIALCALFTLGIALGIAWFPALAARVARTLDPVSLIGHASYLLAALSFSQSRMLHAPVLFEIDKNLLHNLALMDEFLVDLHQRYQATVDGDAHQMRIAGAMGAEIYMEIHRDSGMQPSRLQVRAV